MSSFLIVTTIAIGLMVTYYIYKITYSSIKKTKYGDNRLIKLNHDKQHQSKFPPKLALVTDLDHTLFGKNTNETHSESNQHVHRFNDIWLTQYAINDGILIYATGRNFEKYQLAVKEWDILKPDILVTQDGVSIHWFNKSLAQKVQFRSTHKIDITFDDSMDDTQFIWKDTSYEALLSQGWNQSFAEQIHSEVCQKFDLLSLPKGSKSLEPFRVGVLCQGKETAKQIEQYYIKRVKEYNDNHQENEMEIHSFICIERNIKDNDNAFWSAFTPNKAGKGSAIEFLRKRLHLKEGEIICMGDSGNDISMLSMDGYNSVIMANASQELDAYFQKEKLNGNHKQIMKTKGQKTLGVIEGLNHFGPKLLKH